MRIITFTILLIFTSTCFAGPITGEYKSPSFEQAENEAHLTWIVESTKVGLFASDVYGYVLNYNYQGDYDEQNQILRDLTLTFPIEAMNSDSEGRDEKLHNKCLGKEEFKVITVKIPGPLFLKDKRKNKVKGTVVIRGKEKSFEIDLQSTLEEGTIKLVGESTWSLKELEIPDPSIAVAKLSDEIRLKINLFHKN